MALPAVLLVLAACLGGLRLGVERIRLVDAAGQTARSGARGEPTAPRDGIRVGEVRRTGDLVCADVREDVPLLGLPVPLSATSCALGGAAP